MIDYCAPLDELPDPLPIVPLEKPFDVTITPPGSKSITNRAYVLAALAKGESRIIRPLRAEDTDLLLKALCTLGAEARWDGEDVLVKGVAGRFLRGGSVYLGDGGTPTRFMIAAACLAAEPVNVDGSKRMRERPIAEGVEMLRQLGARIEYVEEEGRLPVRVVPSDSFKGGELRVGKTASSQFVSAVMLIAPWLDNGVVMSYCDGLTSAAYVLVTFKVLHAWHVCAVGSLRPDRGSVRMPSEGRVEGQDFHVECDASSAAYWFAAAAVVPGSRMRVPHLGVDFAQPDLAVPGALIARGWLHHIVNSCDFTVCNKRVPRPLNADCRDSPDGALALAVASTRATLASRLTGLHTLRVKETDRLAALANELRKVGCTVETMEDSITITPGTPALRAGSAIHGSESRGTDVIIETYNDHRMAMSFAILGLVRPGISIRNPKCVAKSYPTFWQDFAKLYQ